MSNSETTHSNFENLKGPSSFINILQKCTFKKNKNLKNNFWTLSKHCFVYNIPSDTKLLLSFSAHC